MIGRTLGTYRIIEKIGMGGMATVYKAYDPNTDRHVAVKVLPEYHSSDSEFYERFRREAKAIAKLEHINILPVHAYGEEGGTAYLVMRYLPTGTLSEHIRQGKMPYDQISRLLKQIASALDYAHEQGVIHRDVKPSNVLLDEKGNAYLTDFGLARMTESAGDLTGSNMLGTPQYMSPEQCQGRKDLTSATDIYSLGVVLYEMVTGETPFQAETPLAVIHMQLSEPLPPPRTLRPDVPEAVESVIYKAMAKQPEARHKNCTAMADAFDRALAAIPAAPIAPPPAKTSDPDTVVGVKMGKLPDEQTAVLQKTQMTAPLSRGLPMWAIAVGVAVLLIAIALASGVFSPPAVSTPTQAAIIAESPDLTSAVVEDTPIEVTAESPTEEADAATQTPTPIAEQSTRVLDGHTGAVLSVAFSADGRQLVSGGEDSTLRVWDTATGEELINIPLDDGQGVLSLDFSTDGRFLAAGGVSDVRLSRADTLTDAAAAPLTVLAGGVVRDVAFSSDSQYLIYGGDDQVLMVYRVNDGTTAEVMHALEGHTQGINSVAFSPDGVTMASGGGYEDGRVILWDLPSHGVFHTLETGEISVDSVDFSPDGLRLAASTTNTLQIWDVTTGMQLGTVNSGTYAATYSPDGRLIATTYDGGMIGLVNVQTGEEIAQLSGHSETARTLAFSPDGMTLASAGADGTIRLWSMAEYLSDLPAVTPLPIATVTSRTVELDSTMLDLQINTFGVQFSPSGYQIAFGASDGALRLWIPTTGELVSLSVDDQVISSVVYSPGRSLLATGGVGLVRIWDTRSNRQIFTVDGGVIDSLAFSPDGQTFAFGGDNDVVEVWSLATRERLYAFTDATSDIEGLSFSPNGELLAASGSYGDGHVRFYDLTTGELVRDINTPIEQGNAVYAGTFSPDGTMLAAVTGNGGVFVWNAETGEEIISFAAAGYGLTFSPDSTLLATGDDSGIIYLWNARTGEQVRTISGHTARVEDLAFSPDGTRLVSTSEDGTVRLWDVGDE